MAMKGAVVPAYVCTFGEEGCGVILAYGASVIFAEISIHGGCNASELFAEYTTAHTVKRALHMHKNG